MKPSAKPLELNRDELNWDIERYLLEDPSMDRQQFEERMLADVDLGLAVAEGVRRLESLGQASRQLAEQPSSSLVSVPGLTDGTAWPVRVGYGVAALAALAASLLVATSWISTIDDSNLSEPTSQNPSGKSPDDGMSVLADRWLAIQVDQANADEPLLNDRTSFTSISADWLEQGEQPATSDGNEGDWMLETSAEFFQQADI